MNADDDLRLPAHRLQQPRTDRRHGAMNADDDLRLPGDARRLWLAARHAVKEALTGIERGPVEYRIGGGTILAARWHHRESYDIDITVDEKTPLRELQRDSGNGFEPAMEALGGRPVFSAELNMFTVVFAESKIDLWARNPMISAGHGTVRVEGEPEVVLSTAQILRGKLERADLNVVRDVYDVVTAAEHDPAALEAAVNAVPRGTAQRIGLGWHWSGPELAQLAADQLKGVPPHAAFDPRRLGHDAANAVYRALYDELRIRTADETVVVEATTRSGRQRRMSTAPESAGRTFETLGLNAHLETKNPGPRALLEYAATLCRRGEDALVYEEREDTPTRWRTAAKSFNWPPDTAEADRPEQLR